VSEAVPSYRIALERELEKWKGFRFSLRKKEDFQAFEAMMDACRNNAMVGGTACHPNAFQSIAMSILLAQQKKISELEKKLGSFNLQKQE
jgi:hypothetical protein